MSGDHDILVGMHHSNGDRTAGRRDDRRLLPVLAAVESDSQELETGADALPNRGGMLPDTGGEDQGVESAEHGRQRTEMLPRLIAVHLDRQCRPLILSLPRQEVTHVRAPAGYAEQSGLLIEHMVQSARA